MVLQNSSDPTDTMDTYDILLFTGNVALGESCLHLLLVVENSCSYYLEMMKITSIDDISSNCLTRYRKF